MSGWRRCSRSCWRHLDRGRSVPGWLARDTTVDPRDEGILGGHFHPHHYRRAADVTRHCRATGHLLSRLHLGPRGYTNLYALALGAGVLIVTLGTASISPKIPGAFFGLASPLRCSTCKAAASASWAPGRSRSRI